MGLLDGLLGHGTAVDDATLERRLEGILIDGETARLAFKIIRDVFVFTERRVILIDVQGATGSKVEFMSVPYRTGRSYAFRSRRPARSISTLS